MLPRAYLLLIVCLILGAKTSALAEVVITEAMYDPSGDDGWGGTSPNGNTEYVEILNVGPAAVDITGWVLDDAQGELGACSVSNGDFILAPGEYAVLIVQDTTLGAAPGIQNYKDAWGIPDPPAAEIVILAGWNKDRNVQLNNTASDQPLRLFTSTARTTLVDAAVYPDIAAQGAAVYICTEPAPTSTDNDAGGAWNAFGSTHAMPAPGAYLNPAGDTVNFGASDAGTPGRSNSSAACPCSDLLALHAIAAGSTFVTPGSGPHAVRFTAESRSLSPLFVISASLQLIDASLADVTSEYSIVADPANPTIIAPLSVVSFTFAVTAGASLTLGDIAIDAEIEVDDMAGCTFLDLEAESIDRWRAEICAPGGSTLCGECDGDGFVTILDSLMAARTSAGMTTIPLAQSSSCDVTMDLRHTTADALVIAQFIVGLRSPLQCCTQSPARPPAVGEILIAEIMVEPAALVAPTAGQWFELRNVAGALLDYSGLLIQVDGAFTVLPPGLAPVPPGAGFIVGRNADPMQNGGVLVNHVFASFALNSSGSNLSVELGPQIISTFTYSTAWPLASGVAAQLDPTIASETAAQSLANWCAATLAYGDGGLGTPSGLNPQCALLPIGCGISPNSCADLTINEVNADSFGIGGDATEFIEIHNPTGASVDLAASGYVLALFDGATDTCYLAVDLGGGAAGPIIDVDCFYLIGSSGVDAFFSLPAGTTQVVLANDTIQDGVDAIVLFKGAGCSAAVIGIGAPAAVTIGACEIVDAVVYDTGQPDDAALLAALSQTEQLDENSGVSSLFDSIQRNTDSAGCPQGISGSWAPLNPMTGGSEN